MPVARKLKAFLDENQVHYHVLTHHERFTSMEIAEQLHVPGQELAKVVIVKADGKQRMAVLPANYHVDLVLFAKVIGADVAELADEEEFKSSFPDCEVGAMPPFGNLYDMEVFVDTSLTRDEKIVFEAGNHKEAIKLRYEDFARLVEPKIAEFVLR